MTEELDGPVETRRIPVDVEALPLASWEGASHRTWPLVAAGLAAAVALAIVWVNMFNRDGAFNSFLGWFGIEGKAWVNDPDFALGTLILLAVWQFGAPMVIFLAGLKQVPTELYEAAKKEGEATWYIARYILGVLGFEFRNPYKLRRQKAFIVPEVIPENLRERMASIVPWDSWDPDVDRWEFDPEEFSK